MSLQEPLKNHGEPTQEPTSEPESSPTQEPAEEPAQEPTSEPESTPTSEPTPPSGSGRPVDLEKEGCAGGPLFFLLPLLFRKRRLSKREKE